MGVKGLQSFIDTNSEFTQPHKLHSCHLVMDASNLLYHLYYTCRADYIHGGDYHRFVKHLRKYFGALLQCDIVPVLVFDGGIERDGSKFPKQLERAKIRTAVSRKLARQERCSDKIIPVLTRLVLEDTLRELGVVSIQSAYEADYEISALANQLSCPVASQDSDFYIYHLPQGLIRLDTICPASLRTETLEDGSIRNYIACKIYHSSNFGKYFPGLDLSLLPFFGSVAGNDIIYPSQLFPFFDHISLPKTRSRKYLYSKQHVKLIGLLEWLQNKDQEEALEGVLKFFKQNVKESVQNQITTSVNQYNKCRTNLAHFVKPDAGESITESELATFTGKKLPSWVVSRFHQNKMASSAINAVGMHKLILQTQVEDFSEPSTNDCSRYIRRVIYTIFLRYDYGKSLESSEEAFVEEYDRKGINLAKKKLEPIPDLFPPDFDLLREMPNMDEGRRRDFFVSLLQVEPWVKELPSEFVVFACVLQYTIRHSDPKLTPPIIATILLTHIYFSLIWPLAKDKSVNSTDRQQPPFDKEESEKLSLLQLFRNIGKEDAMLAFTELSKCHAEAAHGKKLDIVPIHHLNQFQTSLSQAICLNLLLLEPFRSANIAEMVNGPFSFNLYRRMVSRTQLKNYISILLGFKPSWLNSFVIKCFEQLLPPSSLTDHQPPKHKLKTCKVKRS